jgi:hypothetical protein
MPEAWTKLAKGCPLRGMTVQSVSQRALPVRTLAAGVVLGVTLGVAIGLTLGLSCGAALSAPRAASPTNPDLDTDDQLAPSQMQQTMPGAVSQPAGGASAPAGTKHRTAQPAAAAGADSAAPASVPVSRAARPTPAASMRAVACGGIFSKDSSHLRLAMAFDSRNITFTDVTATGGTKVEASVIFPNDPKRRLEVWWANPAARSQTYLIVINGKSTWAGPGGMKLGLTLEQLEKLNHKPFKLKGFDQDGVASISDWDGGALSTLPGGCKSGVSLRADPKADASAVSALTADKEYASNDPEVRAVKPTVSELLIGY